MIDYLYIIVISILQCFRTFLFLHLLFIQIIIFYKMVSFYCLNQEQDNGQCADFKVRYCCPKTQIDSCSTKGYEWTSCFSRDTAAGSFEPNQVCSNPIGARVTDTEEDGGSHDDFYLGVGGYICLNQEQSDPAGCSDHAISFCCPVDKLLWWNMRDDPVWREWILSRNSSWTCL